jgi:hypothetical protein
MLPSGRADSRTAGGWEISRADGRDAERQAHSGVLAMIYLNLKTSTLRAPEYIGSEPTQRGTWLNLLCAIAASRRTAA